MHMKKILLAAAIPFPRRLGDPALHRRLDVTPSLDGIDLSRRGVLRVKGDRIVVAQAPSTKPRFSKRTGEITIDVKNVGKIQRGRLVPTKI